MGRRKTYDRAEVTDAAMQLFWERGYHATSMRDVTDATDVNPSSIYAEFGSKKALYEAAVERYDEVVITGHFGRLERPESSLEDIAALLRYFGGSPAVKGVTLGCLLCNAATEQAPTAQRSQVITAQYADRLTTAFGTALEHAEAAGRLVADVEVVELARFFTVLVLGMFVLLRAGGDPTLLRAAATQGLDRLAAVTCRGDEVATHDAQ